MGALKKTDIEKTVDPILIERKLVLNSVEAMFFLGYGPTKFWKLVSSGKLKGWKDGQWRFEKKELENYKKRLQFG